MQNARQLIIREGKIRVELQRLPAVSLPHVALGVTEHRREAGIAMSDKRLEVASGCRFVDRIGDPANVE